MTHSVDTAQIFRTQRRSPSSLPRLVYTYMYTCNLYFAVAGPAYTARCWGFESPGELASFFVFEKDLIFFIVALSQYRGARVYMLSFFLKKIHAASLYR